MLLLLNVGLFDEELVVVFVAGAIWLLFVCLGNGGA